MNNLFTYRLVFIQIILLLISIGFASAQDDKRSERQRYFNRDSVPELNLKRDTTKVNNKRKKKIKKNVFYGKKCKKGFTKKGKKAKQVLEIFWYLKKFELPDPYIKDIYVFDIKERKILERDELLETDKSRYKVLHGPYKRSVGGEPVEMGIFYNGMKHSRWEKFGKGFILLDKVNFYRGWQKEAEISYYDNDRKKIKEVLPYKFKNLNGVYYLFSETGQVLIHGKYQDDQKVGKWVEYFAETGKRKKETKYTNDIYKGEQLPPQVINEWDDKGTPIIKDGKPFDPSKKGKSMPKRKSPAPSKKKEEKTTAPSSSPDKTSPNSDKKTEEKKTSNVIAEPVIPSTNNADTTKSIAPKPKLSKEEIKKLREQRMK
ncbi:MAG: hypothetical protein EAZ07_09035 [Cytophagales bacterium]|nr:MAG: hypothetical protein EAZ07_09035 [Cytophagales bacterium]